MAFLRPSHIAALVIVAAAALAYANTFSVPFLFDDNSSIAENPTIRSLATAWSPPQGGGQTVSGRPFLNFTLALNYAMGGTSVWGYHLVNLLIHIAAGCTLFGIVRRTMIMAPCRSLLAGDFAAPANAPHVESPARRLLQQDSWWLAFAVAMIWTLHPMQTQSVTYIIQRAESLLSLMYLLTLWGFIRSTESGASKGWLVFTWVACLLGMASKEVMVTAPVMVALYDRIFIAGSWREAWRQRRYFHLALFATWVLLAWLVIGTQERGGTAGFGTGMNPFAYALTQAGAIVHYLRLAFWPTPLVFDYGKDVVAGWREVWWQVLVLLPLAIASIWAAWRGRAAGFLGVFFFAALAPSSSFLPVVTQTMSEHRVYLALAAVVCLVVGAVYSRFGRGSLVVFGVVAVALGATTVRRNQDYRTELGLWEDTAMKRPNNVRALITLGELHQKAGRIEEARAMLEEATRVAPKSFEARNNLGNAWMKAARWPDAIRCFEEALAIKPDEPFVLSNLGNALLQVGKRPEAIAKFEAALRVKPDFGEPRFNLANTLAQGGRTDEALTQYDLYLRMKPDDAEARSNYAATLQMIRRFPEAVAQMEIAVKLRPDDAEVRNNLGVTLAQAGRPAEAMKQFEEALRLRPDFEGARQNLQRARADAGR